jgi:hypothetical protein
MVIYIEDGNNDEIITGVSRDLTDEHIMIDASQRLLVSDSTAYLGARSLCIEYAPYRQNKIDPQ